MIKSLIIVLGIMALPAVATYHIASYIFRPPVVITAMHALNTPEPGQVLRVAQTFTKSKLCSATWHQIITTTQNEYIDSHDSKGLGSALSSEPKIAYLNYRLLGDLEPGEYIFRAVGKFDCGGFDYDYVVTSPDLPFTVLPKTKQKIEF
jgi:hypothetical protein